MLRECGEQFARTLDALSIILSRSVGIDEVYVFTGLKARERHQPSRSRVWPRVDVVRMTAISHLCSSSLIAGLDSGT
jgi:hypothetical protein